VRNKKLWATIGVVCAFFVVTAESCDSNGGETSKSEKSSRDDSYARQVKSQPAHRMDYSPTRDTINAWIDTWGKKGQLSFVYLLSNDGSKKGYFVFQGPPVTYCAALTPTWTYEGTPNDDSDDKNQRVPAPSVDGVYYSGGQCSEYIGRDATTGQILDFTAGVGLNFVSSTQPLYLDEQIQPLGITEIKDVRKVDGEYVVK